MALLNREFNFPRKSHRLDILLLVQVDGKVYKTSDWSMTGVGIVDSLGDFKAGDTKEAKLVLPVVGASLQLDVTLVYRNQRNSITGCEFEHLSNRNRRVLRHFIELAMEGRLDSIEDLVSDFTAPDIETPIGSALSLSEEEEISLLAKFKSRASFALVLGVLFALFLSFSLWYNLVFLYKTVGVVSGDFIDISTPLPGQVKSVLYNPGDVVHGGDILFELSSVETERAVQIKHDLLEDAQAELKSFPVATQNSDLLKGLKDEFDWKSREYQSATKLYDKGIISIKDFDFVRNSWSRARINYLRLLQQKGERQFISAQQQHDQKKSIRFIQREISSLNGQLESYRIRSPIAGKVYAIGSQAGEYVDPGEVVVVLSRDERQSVLFKMPSDQAAKVVVGSSVRFFSYATKQIYVGNVAAIGYKAVDLRSGELQEVSLNQTVIRVDLKERVPGLLVNSRVKVWVRKQFDLPGFFDYFLPGAPASEDKET